MLIISFLFDHHENEPKQDRPENKSLEPDLDKDDPEQEEQSDNEQMINETKAPYLTHSKRRSLRERLIKGYKDMSGINLELADESLIDTETDQYSAFKEGE
jgi:hypothetical protein